MSMETDEAISTINLMSGAEVAEFILAHMERGQKVMLEEREGTDFARGFNVAVGGMKAGLQVLGGASKGDAIMTVLHEAYGA